ncbi:MAG: GntR family transcriptional regulator [Phycisphaeraceae bacterium]
MSSASGEPLTQYRHQDITLALRQRIVGGALGAGSRLPIRAQLQQMFDASPTTVQRAMDTLKRQGFVESRGKRGTFVVDQPPHLARYGLVLPYRPSTEKPWEKIFSALVNQATAISRAGQRRIVAYYASSAASEGDDLRRLRDDLAAQRIAGLFFASNPAPLLKLPLLANRYVPMVALLHAFEHEAVEAVEAVWVNRRAFFTRAFDHLAAQGCRRVAIIASQFIVTREIPHFEQFLQTELSSRGMESRPYWLQYASPDEAIGAANIVRLLMREGQPDRPDGLVIADDNVAHHAASGLAASGVKCGGDQADLHVVAHCNYPDVTPSAIPMARIGFSAADIMATALDALEKQRDGRVPQHVHLVPPLTEAEFAANREGHIIHPDNSIAYHPPHEG